MGKRKGLVTWKRKTIWIVEKGKSPTKKSNAFLFHKLSTNNT